MKISLAEMFWIFFKISLVLIGGGYVLLPISIDEFSKKRNLLTQEEIINFYALSQCLPGVIVVKTAVFIGYHLRGKGGAVIALLGLITPPFFAILIVANLLNKVNPEILSYINTITIAVIVLVGASFIELAGVCLRNTFTIILFILTILLFIFTNLQPVIIIFILTVLGLFIKFILRKIKNHMRGKV
ncbi:chromate transporter [bacterium]|nr:chromate transporter [bacterium]